MNRGTLATVAGRPGARADRAAVQIFLACTLLTAGTAATLLGVMAVGTGQFFAEVSPWRFLTGSTWAPFAEDPRFGVAPLLAATGQITAGAVAVAAPLGTLSAVYVQYYAAPRPQRAATAALALLASVPTVVFAYVAVSAVAPVLSAALPGAGALGGAAATIVVGLAITPTVAFLAREALAAVPRALLEAGTALGASRGQVVARVAAPAAARGLVAALLLAAARAAGETMIVAMAAGSHAELAWSPLEGARTLTAFLAQAGLGDARPGSLDAQAVLAVATLLFAVTCAVHAVGRALLPHRRPAIPGLPHAPVRAAVRKAAAATQEGRDS